MTKETKKCQNCKKEFIIESDDFDFYEKIKVPPPTWCPECRLIRQLSWRNIRSLYKRKCDATGKNLISVYSPDKNMKVYYKEYWWSDEWNPLDYSKDYDFHKPFFEQLHDLIKEVPWPNLVNKNSVNSEYCSSVLDLKNCYFVFGSGWSENVYYSNEVDYGKDSVELSNAIRNENCYELLFSDECYRAFFSAFSVRCIDSAFLWDCKNCSNCFGCVDLRNKQYYIFNKPCSKEEYFDQIKKYDLGSYQNLESLKKQFHQHRLKYPHKYARLLYTVNSTGDNLNHAKNAKTCFDALGKELEDAKYITLSFMHSVKDCQSVYSIGENSFFVYDSISLVAANSVKFSKKIWAGYNIYYSYNCHDSHDLFGCIGLRHKQYCILNKQYTKEEYEKLVPKIIQHMNEMPYIDKKGRIYKYGEFFPPELSPFCYNETIAQEYFPLSKAEAESKGYSWKDPEERDIKIDIKTEELPDHIKDVKDDIVGKVIECQHQGKCNEQCTEAFKIIPQELAFYRKMNLPLPRLCPNCRHYQRLKQRNPLKLWHRKCQCRGEKSENGVYKNTTEHFHGKEPCLNEFETTYAPERPEIVYCEECYLREVV